MSWTGRPQQRWSCTAPREEAQLRGAPPAWSPALEAGRDKNRSQGFSCLFGACCLPQLGADRQVTAGRRQAATRAVQAGAQRGWWE